MLKKRFKLIIITLLAVAIIVPTQIALVSSSYGYIKINSKTESAIGQQVNAGGNVNLYFGGLTWSGSQFYLLLSQDLSTQVSFGDYIYTPRFSVANLVNPYTKTNYSKDNDVWTIGDNWVNGSFAWAASGSYSVKAFDDVSESVAVTDTYIIIDTPAQQSTFQIAPSSGPGGINALFTGSGYSATTTLDVAYYDQTYYEWRFWRAVTTNQSGGFSFYDTIPDLGRSNYQGDVSEIVSRLQFRTQSRAGLVYSYANYDQYARGLKQIGSLTAYGLYGNNSNLASTVKVKTGETITITGKWFNPNDVIYILLDSEAVVGSVTGGQWSSAIQIGQSTANSLGYFEATVTIPSDIDGGEHFMAVEDSQSKLIVKITITAGTLQISPATGGGGANVQFTGSGYPPSATVTLSYRDTTYSSWNYWTDIPADSAGNINFNVEIPDLGKKAYSGDSYNASNQLSFRTEVNGRIFAFADYTQYARGLKQVGGQTATYLYGDCTNFTQTDNLKVKVGDSLTLRGAWFHPGVVYIRWDGVAVVGTVTNDQWLNASIIGSTIAGTSGSFDTAVSIPQADAGNHYLAIEDGQTILRIQLQVVPSPTPSPTYSPSPTASPAPTPTPTPSPNKPTPTINVACKSAAIANGFRVEINGLITCNGTGLAKAVQLYYSNNGGNNWESLTLVNSGVDGKFSAVWISPASGNFVLKAVSEGNTEYNQGTTQVNFVISETPDKNVLSVTSNSTITQFKFDSETNQISFKAEGASHTNGYVAINVPKTLVEDVSNLKVYLDGSEVTFNSELQIDTWVITIHYSHSVHTIVMDLSGTSNVDNQPSEPPTYTIAIVIAAIVIIAIAAVAVLKKKQKINN